MLDRTFVGMFRMCVLGVTMCGVTLGCDAVSGDVDDRHGGADESDSSDDDCPPKDGEGQHEPGHGHGGQEPCDEHDRPPAKQPCDEQDEPADGTTAEAPDDTTGAPEDATTGEPEDATTGEPEDATTGEPDDGTTGTPIPQ